MVGPTPTRLKLEDIFIEDMGFILNSLDYIYVAHDGDPSIYYTVPCNS